MYGLTRTGMNAWLLQQEHKWMTERQIKYSEDDVGIQKTKLRGFVYLIMNSKFSNSTIKLFCTVVQRHSNFKEELKADTVDLMCCKWINLSRDNH